MECLQDESNGVSTSDSSGSSSSSNLLMKETPKMQVMDRSIDESHRIPSSVFELDQSSDPVQWSTSSTDSLFSIYIGNTGMSFDDSDHWCSDERGMTTGEEEEEEEASRDGPVPLRTVSDRPSVKLRQVETSLETVNEEEDSRGSDEDSHEKSFAEGRGSNASVTSFAFPILSGKLDKDSPVGCTARFSEQQQPEPASSSMVEATEPLPPQSEPPNAPQKPWFSCFPCCS